MAAKLPYMLSTGLIPKILEKIQDAKRPERFTQDFLGTKLGQSGGSARSIIPLLKRMGFLGSDGVPTTLYDQFRNPETQGYAVSQGMKQAFSELFDRNEYAHELTNEKLKGLVVEITGDAKDARNTTAIVATFHALRESADFEGESPNNSSVGTELEPQVSSRSSAGESDHHIKPPTTSQKNFDLRVGYTINLNLPETNDPTVFNAIFKALRANLLEN